MSKIKRFFRQTGLTKAQLIASLLCYFLCFALLLGVVVIWDPMSRSPWGISSVQPLSAERIVPDGPTIDPKKHWSDEGIRAEGYAGGSGTSSNPYKIANAQQMGYFAHMVDSGNSYTGKYFKLTADIDLSAYSWSPIGESTKGFSGNFDGDDFTIYGMFSSGGLFYSVVANGQSCVIENVRIKDSKITLYDYSSGGIVNTITGGDSRAQAVYIKNCHNAASFEDSSGIANAAGIVYRATGLFYILYCANSGFINAGQKSAGILGDGVSDLDSLDQVSSIPSVIGCINTGNIGISTNYPQNAAGIVASCSGIAISDCHNYGDIYFSSCGGGILSFGGAAADVVGYTIITYCTNSGAIIGDSNSSAAGGIVGDSGGINSPSIISYCTNYGTVDSSGDRVGGIVGRFYDSGVGTDASFGAISLCVNEANVEGGDYVGGICGQITGGSISWCYNKASVGVSGSSQFVGGIAGEINGTSISECYVELLISVKGWRYVGGIVGSMYNTRGASSITNCVAFPTSIESTAEGGWAPIGIKNGGSYSTTVTNTYYIMSYSGTQNYGTYVAYSDISGNLATWFKNTAKFSDVWDLSDNTVYLDLHLYGGSGTGSIGDTSWQNQNSGSQSDPYIISDAQDLIGLSFLVNSSTSNDFDGKYFKQTKDIDLCTVDVDFIKNGGIIHDDTLVFISKIVLYGVVNFKTLDDFAGNYDGGDHYISGIATRRSLFENLTGSVSNLKITDSYCNFANSSSASITNCVNDNHDTLVSAGIVNSSSSSITSCYNYGDVTGGSGIVDSSSSSVSKCANFGDVSGSSYLGGIVGSFSGSTVSDCFNTGEVSGTTYVGGIVGNMGTSNQKIANCYNTGYIHGTETNNVGGILGRAANNGTRYTSNLYLYNSFNLGKVDGAGIVGGVIWSNTGLLVEKHVYLYNCHNFGDASGNAIVGPQSGSTSRNYLSVSSCYFGANYSKTTTSGGGTYNASLTLQTPKDQAWYTNSSNWDSSYPWNFTTTWTISQEKNSGYPVLVDLPGDVPITYWNEFGNYSIDWFTNPGTNDGSSASNPYIIDSAADLAGLSYLVYSGLGTNSGDNFFADKYFKQTVDIDLTGHYWQPIGISYDRLATQTIRAFAGNYDGGGHTVSSISTPAGSGNGYSYQGLFGYVRSSSSSSRITIQNVGVINSHIQGYSAVGGVVGYAKDVDITNCFNTASVNASQYAAGIVGRVMDSDISINKCYNTGRVTAENYIGGILGEYQLQEDASGTALIQNCYNAGIVSAEGTSNNNVGGIAGRVATNSATISGDILVVNCYNRGTISGGTRIAGIIGESYSQNDDIVVDIINCFNVGTIANTGDYGSETVCHNGGSQPFVSGFQYKSAAESGAKTIEFFTNFANWNATDLSRTWDFRTVWKFDPSVSEYPVLRAEGEVSWWTDDGNYSIDWFTNAGTNGGSASNPYTIDSAADLAGLSWLVYTGDERVTSKTALEIDANFTSFFYNKHFKLASDINLAAHMWQPIGIMNDSANNCFGGIFDGNGHTIKGVFTLEENGSMQSVFGTTYSPDESYPSSIQNLMVTNSVIKGTSCVGGILGYAFFNSQIINCKFSGEIYGSAGSIGGIVGEITDCLISGCVNNGTVTNAASAGSDYIPIGGIVGYANTASTGAKIEYSANYGKVIGKNTAGGIVGHNMSAEIYYCTNNGDVSSSDSSGNGSVGGIVGRIKSTAKISLSQNNGKISGYNYVGGIIGISESNIDTESNIATLEIYSCINNGAIIGTGGSIGGIAGQTCMTNLKLCINYGDVTALNNFGGIVGQLIGQGAIKYCYAEFKLTQTKEHCAGGGIVGLINHNSATGPDAFEITNCYVDVTMSLITSDEVGAILGVDYSKGTYQPVVIENCAAFVNGENVAARLLGGARAGSKLTFNLCYGVFNGSSKIIEGENFDGNFAYISNFKEGRPIPLGIFHILDFGTKTGIKTRVNAL